MVDIESLASDGNIGAWLVPTIADTSAPSLATDLAAPSDISCYLTKDGLAITTEQATITDERLCSVQVFGRPGSTTYTMTLTGVDNTNSTTTPAQNLLVETLVEGTLMYLVRRRGVPYDQALAVGDTVSVVPFQVGARQDVPAEGNSIIRSTWQCFVTGEVQADVAVVA